MSSFTPHHLTIGPEHTAGNGGAGRVFFVPGSDGRARRLGELFVNLQVVPSDRQLNVYLGRVERDGRSVEVGAVATGMGCPSLDIVVTELILLGARRFLRVGTAGSLRPDTVRAGALVIATAAVRDEGTSTHYIGPEYPALADVDVVQALEVAARRCGVADRTFRGVVHSKDSLYAREFLRGPRAAENEAYMQRLRAMGVLASEMEAAHLFILSHAYSAPGPPLSGGGDPAAVVKSGALLAVIGDDRPFATREEIAGAEQAAMEVAFEAALELGR